MPAENQATELEAENQTPELEAANLPAVLERTPTVLLLDTSSSMRSETRTPNGEQKPKIDQLNEGVGLFDREVSNKEEANKRVDVSLITFGSSPQVEQEFRPVDGWSPTQLSASGRTSMGAAIERAISLVEDRKSSYRQDGIAYKRPLIWLLTDGQPTDMDKDDQKWNEIQQELRDGAENKHFEFFALGVSGANMRTLNALVREPTNRPALKLEEGKFKEFFRFLSNSIVQVSDSDSDDDDQLDLNHLRQFTDVSL